MTSCNLGVESAVNNDILNRIKHSRERHNFTRGVICWNANSTRGPQVRRRVSPKFCFHSRNIRVTIFRKELWAFRWGDARNTAALSEARTPRLLQLWTGITIDPKSETKTWRLTKELQLLSHKFIVKLKLTTKHLQRNVRTRDCLRITTDTAA